MNDLMCLDSAPNLLGIFDTTIAPSLLYYSYIPIVFLALFFSVYVYIKSKSLQSLALLLVSLIFSTWIINEIIQWISVYASLVNFGWQISSILQSLVVFSSYVLVNTLIKKKFPGTVSLIVNIILLLPIVILLPTSYNIVSFDLVECLPSYGTIYWQYVYIYQIVIAVLSAYICFEGYKRNQSKSERKQSLSILFSIILLLGLFIFSNVSGDVTLFYEFNLIGPLGMALFIVIISYTMVRFKLFNVKVFNSQILVYGLIFLIFAALFINSIYYLKIVLTITFALSVLLGLNLIKSVKKEIETREKIEQLAKNLQKANDRLLELDKQKSEFVSFATHQLRAPLTAMKGYASMILEGDIGKLDDETREAVHRIMESSGTLANVVDDYLNISRIELGTMKYNFTRISLHEIVEEVIGELRPNIDKSGLSFEYIPDQSATESLVNVDKDKIKQVIANIIDNTTKYTKTGGIKVYLKKVNGEMLRFMTEDTGIGIATEVMPKLFAKFSRAMNANRANIHGTGLGLFVAKEIVGAHKGKIWAESEGEGKGSKFYVDLPIVG